MAGTWLPPEDPESVAPPTLPPMGPPLPGERDEARPLPTEPPGPEATPPPSDVAPPGLLVETLSPTDPPPAPPSPGVGDPPTPPSAQFALTVPEVPSRSDLSSPDLVAPVRADPVDPEPGSTPRHAKPAQRQKTSTSQPDLRFGGVYLLANGPDGPTAIPDLQLEFGERGVTLSKDDDTIVWAAPWAEIAQLATPERSKPPDGANGVVLVITPHAARAHRFVVPADRPAALEAALNSLARRQHIAPDRPERSQSVVLVTGVIVVVVAVVVVLLLAADHLIHLR